jgi:glucose-6-phosphate 1-epimerase
MSSISITHSKSGAKAEVYTYGATVTSFVSSTGRELLFLSKEAKLDGSKPIRGGIPLVFPQFGQPDSTMPQHGFARCNLWTVEGAYDEEDSAGIMLTLVLADVKNARGGKWAEGGELDCTLALHVNVQPSSLTTTLTIVNSGDKAFAFQTLFHTYYFVDQHQALDSEKCNVIGLEGYTCEDKISGESYIMGSKPVIIDSNIDHIYTPPEGKYSVEVKIQTGGDTAASLKAFGFVDGKEVPTSCVVWK